MMPNVIENRQLINDDWQTLTLAEGEDAATLTLPAEGKLIVPLGLWQARKAELSASQAPLGLLLQVRAEGLEKIIDHLFLHPLRGKVAREVIGFGEKKPFQ